jgi:hypothetical protein
MLKVTLGWLYSTGGKTRQELRRVVSWKVAIYEPCGSESGRLMRLAQSCPVTGIDVGLQVTREMLFSFLTNECTFIFLFLFS